MAQVLLNTVQDAVDHVLLTDGMQRDGSSVMIARRAVRSAYRKLARYMNDVNYYQRIGHINTVASDDGTLTYDHTGGSSERLVTVASITVPTDVKYYKLLYNGVHYKIDKYLSSTTFTLTEDTNPGADVAAGTACTLFRSLYPVPIGFRKMHVPPWDLSRAEPLRYVNPSSLLTLQTGNYQPQRPYNYTIRGTENYIGRKEFELGPPPSEAVTYHYVYEAEPRQFTLGVSGPDKYSTGTITTDGTTTVEGSGTTWTSEMVGCVLRVSTSSSLAPTAFEGNLGDADNPYYAAEIITSVTDADTLVVENAIGAQSGVKYTISDPIDIEDGHLYSAFLSLAEAEYARMSRRDDWKDLFAHFRGVELKLAMQAENPYIGDVMDMKERYSLTDLAANESYDTGGALT